MFFCLVVAVPGVVAQTTVTTSGGTTNTVPLFTGTSTLGNSAIAQSSGGNVGIGTTAPLQKLTIMTGTNVYGAIYGGYGTSTANGDIVLGKTPFFELVGDGTVNDGPGVGLVQLNVGNSSTWASAAELYFGGTRAATASAAGTGAVGNTDILGRIGFFGDDGTNLRTRGAAIDAEVYTANTPVSTGTIPAALNLATYFNAPIIFYTNALAAGAGLNSNPLVGNTNEKMRISANGNVGIGTTSPSYTLDVAGQIRSSSGGIVFPDGSTQTTAYNPTSSGGSAVTTSGGTANTIPLFTGNAAVGNSIITQSGSNIGIGTASPTAQLHIYGAGNQILTLQSTTASFPGISFANPGFNYTNQLDASSGSLYWFNGSSRNMTLLQNGHLGIGTTVPGAMLDVNGQIVIEQKNFGGPAGLLIEGNTVGSNYPNIGFSLVNSNGANVVAGGLTGFITNATAGSESMGVALTTMNSGSALSDLYITPAGNVGVGTTAPAYSLDVSGVARAQSGIIYPDGNKQTVAWTGALCGGDYAESVDVAGARDQYEPGDVMVVDPASPGGFLKSAEPYSTLVAGIYSTKPGVVGRRSTDPDKLKDEVPMAVVGIVPAKVSAENGPVKPGDLLVTSSTPGYAMKGTDRERITGAIVGKALGAVPNGVGVIEVLVSLQ